MSIASQIIGERVAHAVAARSEAREVLVATERQPNSFIVGLNVLCMALSTAFLAVHFGTWIEAMLGALAGGAFALALTGYANGLRHRRRLEAMLVMQETAP